jgi:hypothetical protein
LQAALLRCTTLQQGDLWDLQHERGHGPSHSCSCDGMCCPCHQTISLGSSWDHFSTQHFSSTQVGWIQFAGTCPATRSFIATDSLQQWQQSEFDFFFDADSGHCVLWITNMLSPQTQTRPLIGVPIMSAICAAVPLQFAWHFSQQ